ncbi:MAG: ArdC-like ssDNA-binding domain-containing protein [Solirubrobacteraceae bacterium]
MPRTKTTPSEEERARRREADRQQSIEAVEALRTSAGWQAWLASRRHFHRYSLANQLLIAMQCPHATRVAGFRAWLKVGYCVRRGEKAIRIWVPIAPSKAKLEAWRRAGADPAAKPRTFFKLGPVFDRSQVDELPPPAIPVTLDCPIADVVGCELEYCLEPLVALAETIGSAVTFEPMCTERGGCYDTATRAIAINDAREINAQVKTLIHELSHALLRAEPGADDPELSYAEEELVVESIAYTVCGSAGLDVSGYVIPYLASWSQDAPLDTVQSCAGMIDRYARRLEDVLHAGLAEVAEERRAA